MSAPEDRAPEDRAPEDRAGLVSIGRISLALDPRVYAYGTRVYVSQLFTVEGMR